MALYQYQYIDQKGKHRSGFIEALDEKEAKEKLREQGLFITKLSTKAQVASKQNLKGDQLISFTLQLSQLVNAGIPLYESLVAIEEQVRGESFHRIVLSLCEQVKTGISLSQAMGQYPGSFDRLYCSMIAAGEAVGELGPILDKLTQLLTKQMKLKKQLATALIYPAILGTFSVVVIGVLLGFVVPSLEGIFADRKLNGFTQMILSLSHLFRNYWWFYFPLFIAAGLGLGWKLRSPEGKLWMERLTLKLPLLRTLVVQTAVARFCRTLATLLQGGLSMIEALRISRSVMRNVTLEKEMQAVEGKIVEGYSLSQQLARSKWMPKMVPRMLAVGEEAGTMVAMLGKVADIYEQEIEKSLDRVVSLAQPVILIVMGLVIGAVLLAILIPLTDVSSFTIGG